MPETLIARGTELAALRTFLEAVAAGPAFIRLEGEAGAGKTTIWREAVAQARARSWRVLWCSPVEAERDLSFAALGDLFAPVVDELAGLPGPRRRALRIALLLAETEGPPPDERAVAVAALALLRALAEADPVIVAVDDVQWLDAPTAEVLSFALRRLERERIGVLTSLRLAKRCVDPLETGPSFGRIEVGPLSVVDLGRVVYVRLGKHLPRPTLARLHDACAGNPFFGLELARALLESGSEPAPDEPLPVPKDLVKLLRRRLARLPAATREALVAASAASHPTRALLGHVTGDDLRSAADAGVVELDEDALRFTHPLLASVAYTDAPLEQRRRIHRRLAELVDEPEEQARHLALAAEGPDESVAAALERAALHAGTRGAQGAAAALAEQAVRLTPAPHGPDARRRRLDAAERFFEAGDAAKARALLEDALADTPPGPARARVLSQLGRVIGDVEGNRPALELWRQALLEAGDDLVLRTRLHADVSFFTFISESAQAAEPDARAALELAEEAGDPQLLAQALVSVAGLQFFQGRGLDEELFRRAIELEAEVDQLPLEARPSLHYAGLLVGIGRTDEARALGERLRRLADEQGDTSPMALYVLGWAELWTGNWREAIRHAEEAFELVRQAGRDAMPAAFQTMRALAEAHLGLVDEARVHASEALADAEAADHRLRAIYARSILGFLELSLGDPRRAHEHLAPALQLAEATGIDEPTFFYFVPDAIETLVALGRLGRARVLLERLEEQGRRLDRAWALATASRCRGLLAATRGDRDEAVAAFGAALREHERLDRPFDLARTVYAFGSAERRFQQRRAARERLETALQLFERLGAALWAERARGELAIVGGRAPSPGRLTATEQRIADLVAAGRSNQQVADALYMAPKTVEWNLSKIYRKLRVSSRTELAARLARATSARH